MVTNNETYFFRETHQFDLLIHHVIPERRAELRGRPLRFLSAGCSSGEEPYSLSIALHNAGLPLAGVSWEIDACDLNPERVGRAQEALYAEGSLRACDADARRRYFSAEPAGFRLKEKYRRGVRCFHANLLAPNGLLGWPLYDAILCRNLLIYFSDEAFGSLIGLFSRCLVPGGYLFLGHSESLLDRKTAFVPAMLGGAVVYRKLEAAA
jgi:chemotaxis methyl-accepting protein methylase